MISITKPALGAEAPSQALPQPRLTRAAHEFEAQMMKELLKPMTDQGGLAGAEGDAGSGSGGALGEFAAEALGRGLSERGGLGIAASIERTLSHSGNHPQTARVIANLHVDTVMNPIK